MSYTIHSLREAVDIYYFLKENKKPKFQIGDIVFCHNFPFPIGVVEEVLEPDIENRIYEYRYMVKVIDNMPPAYIYEHRLTLCNQKEL